MPKGKQSMNGRVADLPPGLKPVTRRGGKREDIQKEFKSSYTGGIIKVEENSEFSIAFLEMPDNWTRFEEHYVTMGDKRAYVPCMGKENCEACKRTGDKPNTYVLIPIYKYEDDAKYYFRCPSGAYNTLMKQFDRNSNRMMNRVIILIRDDDSGPTKYTFDVQDEKISKADRIKVKKAKLVDIDEMLLDRYAFGIGNLNWKQTDETYDDMEAYDHVDDDEDDDMDDEEDVDFDDMSKAELIEYIEDNELDIEDPEDLKVKALRRLVQSMVQASNGEDDEDEDEEEEILPRRTNSKKGGRK